ncbi:hypothetical protein, partial [Endozoicomonas sp. ONNA1]|uniref:hypothetical protein n=1 Tax=Endozoicomonas sp. ONNA1 TaxID=2828740 RepID=UPI002147781A
MHQHGIHNHLKTDWGNQGEQLQEKRGKNHFAQYPAVFDHHRNKPADAKAFHGVTQIKPSGHPESAAIPVFPEFIQFQNTRLPMEAVIEAAKLAGAHEF